MSDIEYQLRLIQAASQRALQELSKDNAESKYIEKHNEERKMFLNSLSKSYGMYHVHLETDNEERKKEAIFMIANSFGFSMNEHDYNELKPVIENIIKDNRAT